MTFFRVFRCLFTKIQPLFFLNFCKFYFYHNRPFLMILDELTIVNIIYRYFFGNTQWPSTLQSKNKFKYFFTFDMKLYIIYVEGFICELNDREWTR
jgi:hypothetical protein